MKRFAAQMHSIDGYVFRVGTGCQQDFINAAVDHNGIDFPEPIDRLTKRPGRQQCAIAKYAHAIDYADFQIALECVMLKAIVADQHIHVGMVAQQRARGADTIRRNINRHSQTLRKQAGFVTAFGSVAGTGHHADDKIFCQLFALICVAVAARFFACISARFFACISARFFARIFARISTRDDSTAPPRARQNFRERQYHRCLAGTTDGNVANHNHGNAYPFPLQQTRTVEHAPTSHKRGKNPRQRAQQHLPEAVLPPLPKEPRFH